MTTELNLKDRLNDNVDKAQKQWNAFTVRTSELFETGNARWKELSQQLSIAALFDRLNINQTDLRQEDRERIEEEMQISPSHRFKINYLFIIENE